jgi:hypothetical protein
VQYGCHDRGQIANELIPGELLGYDDFCEGPRPREASTSTCKFLWRGCFFLVAKAVHRIGTLSKKKGLIRSNQPLVCADLESDGLGWPVWLRYLWK